MIRFGTPWRSGPAMTGMFFAALVMAVLIGALAEPPEDLPSYALESAAVYRLELLVGSFALLYLPLAVLFLALQGRGLAKLTAGPVSIEAEGVRHIRSAAHELHALGTTHEADIADLTTALEDLARRVRQLEG